MKVRTVPESTITELTDDEADMVALFPGGPSFWPETVRVKHYPDGRWYAWTQGRAIRADGTFSRHPYHRDWAGSGTDILPGWLADIVNLTRRPHTLTGAPE